MPTLFRTSHLVFALIFVLGHVKCLADGPFAIATPVRPDFAAGFQSITEAESESILRTLVEGPMAGRGTGQEGFVLAAKWFASQLEANGFQPAGPDGSWYQNVPFIKFTTQPDGCRIVVGGNELVSGKSFGISNFAGTFRRSLPVTFARVAKQRPEIEDGSCAGQILLVQAADRIKSDDAFLLKAKPDCILIVADDSRVRNEAVSQSEESPSAIPIAYVTREAANRLAAECGRTPDFFASGNPDTSVIEASSQVVECQLTVDREAIDVPNVVGWYPGSDVAVSEEFVCLGAHLDHLGQQRGELFPGADDNGSGSTAVLQVAKAIHTNPVKPRRSVLLMAFCAEERGLLGSKYFSKNPLKPLEKMVCMLNIDMIGRNEQTDSEPASENVNTIHLVGSRDHSKQLHDLILKANESVGFVFEYDEEDRVDGRSDHASFSEKGIPVAFLFGGFNPHYHKTTDTMDGINFAKIANAARLDYLTLMLAAENGPFVMDEKDVEKKTP